MIAVFKIIADVAIFRLKKLEMANMFAALTIMLAIRLPLVDILIRFGFGLLLNLLVYLNNDFHDVDQDLASPNKDHRKARYLKEHMTATIVAQLGLAAILAAIGLAYSRGLLIVFVLGGGVCWFYSWFLKRRPYIDVIAMMLWGFTMPAVGFPLDNLLGWSLVVQLALFSGCFESIQIIRDHDEDVRSGVRTTAVRLGVFRTMIILRTFMLLSAVYAVLVLNSWFGGVLFVTLLLPFRKERASNFWNNVRLVQGLVWLAMIGWIIWNERTTGLLISITPEETLTFMEAVR